MCNDGEDLMTTDYASKIVSFLSPNGEECLLDCNHIVETPVIEGDFLEINDSVFCCKCYSPIIGLKSSKPVINKKAR